MKFFTGVFSRPSRKHVKARRADGPPHGKVDAEASASRAPTPGLSTPRAFDVADLGRPPVRVYSDNDGLPQVSIYSMAFDKRGYLWVGTQDGAAYYNGRAWTVVDMPNRTLSNWVRALLVGSDGSIWFGTYGGGLARLVAEGEDAGRWRVYDTDSGLPNNMVSSLLETVSEDGACMLWVGTEGGGVALLTNPDAGDAERWRVYDTTSGLPNNVVLSLLETRGDDGSGTGSAAACGHTLWVGTLRRRFPARFDRQQRPVDNALGQHDDRPAQ